MTRPPTPLKTSTLLACVALACGAHGRDEASADASTADPSSTTAAPDPAQEAVDAARERFPTYLVLHTEVIARTCTPNMGVCHNIKEYPDLHTPQTMLGVIDQPCNLAESVALNVYDGCERTGDTIELIGPSNPGFVSEVGYIAHELDAVTHQAVAILVHLRDPIPGAMLDPTLLEGIRLSRTTRQGTLAVGELAGRVSYDAGESTLRIVDYATLTPEEKALVEDEMELGDPNQDGVFGGVSDPFKLIVPGDPTRSYLLQRLLGNVPGSPMPLANEPLSSAEVIALACWIEGITDPARLAVEAAIDYDDCQTAADFGGPNPSSGHSLSNNVQPIFNRFCAIPGCHTEGSAQAGLVLTPGDARASLLDESTQVPGTRRVEAGNPTSSYLINKLTGSGKLLGHTMPITPEGEPGMLEDWQIEIVRAWIVAGAPDD